MTQVSAMPDTISHICIYSFLLSINLLHDSSSFSSFSLGLSFVLNISILNSSTHFVTTMHFRALFPDTYCHQFPEYSSHSIFSITALSLILPISEKALTAPSYKALAF